MRYTVYADINCPFCFALNERFNAMSLDEKVDWRPIQHAPCISSVRYSFESLSDLTAEVMEVRRRVPELNIITPPFRPGTAFISELITEAAVIAPRQATRFGVLGRTLSSADRTGQHPAPVFRHKQQSYRQYRLCNDLSCRWTTPGTVDQNCGQGAIRGQGHRAQPRYRCCLRRRQQYPEPIA